MKSSAVARRVVVVLAVAGLVVLAAVAVPLLVGPEPRADAPVDTAEWDAAMNVDPLDASGAVSPDIQRGDGRRVVIDTSHSNRFETDEVRPLVLALRRANYTVEFSGEANLNMALADAAAFVVIDPGSPYDRNDVAAVRNFTADGGRLLVLAEPDHRSIQQSAFGAASTSTTESFVDGLLGAYDVTLDGRYLYNQRHNDGSYQDVVGAPAEGAALPGGEYAFFTAATLYAPDADPLVVAPPGTRLSQTDEAGRFAVAVRQGNVIAVGDKSFLAPGHHNVGDNERLLAFLIEFLVSGQRSGGPPAGGSTPVGTAAPVSTPAGTTATATGTTTGTPTGPGTATGTATGTSGGTATGTPAGTATRTETSPGAPNANRTRTPPSAPTGTANRTVTVGG